MPNSLVLDVFREILKRKQDLINLTIQVQENNFFKY